MLRTLSNQLLKFIPSHKISFFGSTSLLHSSAPYYILLLVMTVGISLYELTQNPYLLLLIIYAVIPVVDEMITLDTRNPTYEEAKTMAQQIKFQVPLYVTVVVDWAVFLYALNQYSSTQINFLNFFKLIGLVVVISNLNAAQFAVSHQIMHKPGWRRVLGTLHMLKTLNMHFTYEHLFGHHRKVATPQDPASAKKNENVYKFFIRSYFGAYKSVYEMEKQKNKHLFQNAAILSCVASFVFCAVILRIYGSQAFLFYIIQVLGAVFYLEVINFIEHYGLYRKKLANGQYEKVTIRHSWNAPHRLSNYIFFKLQRHSDHHENAMKPYQTLLTINESPQLPHGYIVMTVMALIPSVFQRIMNPLVDNYRQEIEKSEMTESKKIFDNAVQETRVFIMQLAISVCFLFLGSQILIK